jgi:phenylacetate-CoA ligase
MEQTPLERWIDSKIRDGKDNGKGLNRSNIEEYQLRKLKETLALASTKSKFYSRHLAGKDLQMGSLKDMAGLPFTTAEDIRNNPLDFLTVPQGEIQRIVTSQSSGTTGQPKRIFFSHLDQDLTIDFFRHGMSTLVHPGERVLVLLPGNNPGGVGDLLCQALERLGAVGFVFDTLCNPAETLSFLKEKHIDCVVGIPVEVLALAKFRDSQRFLPSVKIKSVLLSTDYVPKAVVEVLKEAWGCRVFQHYGSTEMGLGGGVECQAHRGYHLREADLYFEIIDPLTGLPLTDGEPGEVVFTTLTRQGMPLIRYRTGDLSSFMTEPCPCGTVLKSLTKVTGRLTGRIKLTGGTYLSMPDLDEAVLSIDGVADFSAKLNLKGKQKLKLSIVPDQPEVMPIIGNIQKVIYSLPEINSAFSSGLFEVEVKIREWGSPASSGKRKIFVFDEE